MPNYLIQPEDPETPDALVLLDALSDTLAAITGSSGRASFSADDVRGEGAVFLVAREASGHPVGCGAFRPLQAGVAELKRMYAAPGTQGAGSALLAALEAHAAHLGYAELWLETRLANDRAVRFYERKAYRRIPNFGKYAGRPEAVCFAKSLPAGSSSAT